MLKLLKCGGLIAKRHIEAVIDTRVYKRFFLLVEMVTCG